MVRPANPSSAEIARGKSLIPRIDKVDEVRVERRFWPKLRRSMARIPFADHLLSVWYAARDPQTPAGAKGMMQAALAYAADSLTGMAEGASLVACVTSAAETRALLAAVNAPRPQLDWTRFDQGGRLAATGDTAAAFSGVSSAA